MIAASVTDSDGNSVFEDEFTEARVEFDTDDDQSDYPLQCDTCGESCDKDGTDGFGGRCSQDCDECGGLGDDDGDECVDCDGSGQTSHDPRERPVTSWCNRANIVTDEDEDSVTVMISVADPRGAFTMTIRRIPVDSGTEHAGRLILSVPYPSMGWLHAPLTEIHEGTYLIGH